MKMETPITAPRAGQLRQQVGPGAALHAGQVIAQLD